MAESGLSGYFKQVHVVSEKDPATYRAILAVHGVAPAGFVMVGNSVRSDLLPIIELGGTGVHIPYHVTWAHEVVEIGDRRRNEKGSPYWELSSISQLPALLRQWGR